MGFHELYNREDVLHILKETLNDYYAQTIPEHTVTVGYEKQDNTAEFFLIPRIGAIMQLHPSFAIRKHFYDSYNIRGNLIKHIGAKVIVFLAMHWTKLLCEKERLYIGPAEVVNSQIQYVYCNRSVRIFDYENNTTVSIQKKGFTNKFFQNQLDFRLKHPYHFIPPILDHGETWFEEKIYEGKMLARISDENEYAEAQQKALSYIQTLEKDTLEFWNTQQYVSALVDRLEQMLQRTKDEKATMHVDAAGNYVQPITVFLKASPEQIPMVISHKDLQGGNVLVTPEKTWIIDWETQGRGSRWFDAITMLYGTRYYGGIWKLTQDAVSDKLTEQIGPKADWSAKQILAIFLLEDLEFYLEDMLELPGIAGSATFDRYMTEIQEIDWTTVF